MALSDMARMGMAPEPMDEMKMKLEEDTSGLKMEEDALFMEMAPKGNFSKSALNSLVKAHNKVSEMFGLEPYAVFTEDITEFPAPFVRELAMIVSAVQDAVDAGEIEPEMVIDLSTIRNDRDLASLAGRLDMLSKSKDFRKWLSSAPGEEMEADAEMEVSETESSEPSEDEMNSLFMGRM